MIPISKIMTRELLTVSPEDSLLVSAGLIVKNRFSGLPVVDKNNKLVGIITEYDFILKNQNIHLPTVIKIFQDIDVYKKDSGLVKDDVQSLMKLRVGDVMNKEPFTARDTDSIQSVVESFANHHRVNPIPVVNSEGILTGLVSRHDILRFLAGSSDIMQTNQGGEDTERQVSKFITNLDKNFVLVSKSRTNTWLIASMLFAIVGFAIAWFLILRVNF